MKLIIMSDSHGDYISAEQAIRLHRDADYIIHLGDGEDDIYRINNVLLSMRIVRVRGNCSWHSELLDEQIIEICSRKILCCHGHRYGVKSSLDSLGAAAAAKGCSLALYGHTHIQRLTEYRDGLLLFNPGNIRNGCYGIAHITPDSIICEKMSL